MSPYVAPLREMRFVLNELAGLPQIAQLRGYEEATPDVVDSILDEAAKFSAEVLAPLNKVGDSVGAQWQSSQVSMPPGFLSAYQQFSQARWGSLDADPHYGGQGLPKLVATATMEMWKSANHAFSLCPMLTSGAAEVLHLCGTDSQKKMYLPNMISGKWTGSMNLTEPQAGSDLAAVRSRAEKQPDGTYKIYGQKIFITYGEHNLTENIIHLVLARLPDAPAGVKGLSMFVVPKFLVKTDGSLGERNDVYCVSIEHKLGIHASPTCVMAYGDLGGAIGELVGIPNEGLKYMFILMNTARFAIGMEGLALSEMAYQKALSYAKERVQSRAIEGSAAPVRIMNHPDVQRMLMTMKAQIEAMRALAYCVAAAQDCARLHSEAAERQRMQTFVDLMIPVVKGWLSESSIELTSLGLQVHGGMGYIEEAGAAQYFRDARITTIYEGTTAIQANDLTGRKIARDGGAAIKALITDMQQTHIALQNHEQLQSVANHFAAAVTALSQAATWVVATYTQDVRLVAAGATPFLKLMGIVSGGWMMARAALAAQSKIDSGDTDPFYPNKIATVQCYASTLLPQAHALAQIVMHGGATILALSEEQFR